MGAREREASACRDICAQAKFISARSEAIGKRHTMHRHGIPRVALHFVDVVSGQDRCCPGVHGEQLKSQRSASVAHRCSLMRSVDLMGWLVGGRRGRNGR